MSDCPRAATDRYYHCLLKPKLDFFEKESVVVRNWILSVPYIDDPLYLDFKM